MTKGRVEAFSDGVIAIILTIMVLELKVPHGDDAHALAPVLPPFLAYVLSFATIGIYWNNHHHMLQATKSVGGWVLLANLHLLFWLSLIPVTTGWLGEAGFAPFPTALYSSVLFLSAIAYTLLQRAIVAHEGPSSRLRAAIGADRKGKLTGLLYLSAIPLAYVHAAISDAILVLCALIWFVPDRRIESRLHPKAAPTDDTPPAPH